jgi:hypothetical protein
MLPSLRNNGGLSNLRTLRAIGMSFHTAAGRFLYHPSHTKKQPYPFDRLRAGAFGRNAGINFYIFWSVVAY